MKVYQILLSLLVFGVGLHAADPNPNKFPLSAVSSPSYLSHVCALMLVTDHVFCLHQISCMQQLFPSSEWNSTAYLCADDSRQTALVDCVANNGTTKEEFSKFPENLVSPCESLTINSHATIDRGIMQHQTPPRATAG